MEAQAVACPAYQVRTKRSPVFEVRCIFVTNKHNDDIHAQRYTGKYTEYTKGNPK